jgi:hypothetical protein
MKYDVLLNIFLKIKYLHLDQLDYITTLNMFWNIVITITFYIFSSFF